MSTRVDRPIGLVRIATDGAFGAEVAGHLADLLQLAGGSAEVVPEPPAGELAGFVSGVDVCVRASWRDVLAESAQLATAALTAGRTFLPVAFAHPYVRVGPLVVPGRAPCHRCYAVRVRQHANAVGEQNAVNDAYERALRRDPGLGVTGYPPHVAAIAAGLAFDMLVALDGVPRTGWVARVDCGTDEVRRWRLSPATACPVCGPDTDPEARAKLRRDRLRALARPPGAPADGSAERPR